MSLFKSPNKAEKITCKICGVWVAEESGVRGKAVLPLDIWYHILVMLFYTTLTGRCNALPKKKVPKKYTKRKDRNRLETNMFLLYFPLFTGFNNYSVDEGVFPEYTEMVESPSLRCQKYINSFHVCMCPHLVFRASISVSFLLEVLSKSGKSQFTVHSWVLYISAMLTDRERTATGWRD